jgi:DNA-binding response OmpR family regulator
MSPGGFDSVACAAPALVVAVPVGEPRAEELGPEPTDAGAVLDEVGALLPAGGRELLGADGAEWCVELQAVALATAATTRRVRVNLMPQLSAPLAEATLKTIKDLQQGFSVRAADCGLQISAGVNAGKDGEDVRLLLIEDEKRLAASLKRGLEADGFAVDVAFDGEDGVWLASEQPYDVIVCDIMLPKLNGYAVCAKLRGNGNWTPILMLTAKDGELDEAEALDTGADDFLSKPFSYIVLLARLRTLLRRASGERQPVLVVGDLTLDPATRRCARAEHDVPLTTKEFAVLEYLARREGQVVTKLDILGHVWDFAFDGDPNIVEVYISSLRRKIDAPFGRASIRTLRGAGYQLGSDDG